MRNSRIITNTALLLFACLSASAANSADNTSGDAIAQPPPAFATQMRAIPVADLSGLDKNTREAIEQARSLLSGQLSAPDVPIAALTEAYARLAALYQHAVIDGAAADAWHNAATLQPDDYRWRYYQGWLALNSGHTGQALSAFTEARARKPEYAPLDLRIGQLYLADNRLTEAETALKRAASDPGLRAAALYYLAQIALLQRDYPLALRQLNEARQLAPQATGLHYLLAQALRGLGQHDQAREQLALVPPGSPQAPPAADPLVAELAQVVQSAQADLNSAMQAVRKRDYESAIEHFASGLQIAPDNHNARTSYARTLWLAGQQQAAREQLQQVLDQQSDHVLAIFMLALMSQHEGDEEAAMRLYRRSIELQPKHQGAHYYLASLLFTRGDYRHAAEHYRAAQHGDSELPAASLLAVIADAHAGASDVVLAVQLRALVEKFPDQSELRYALLRLSALSSDPEVHDDVSAVTMANQLMQQRPGPATMQALAVAVAANGQFGVAVDIQQQLIERLKWVGATELQRLQDQLAAYQQQQMPPLALWPKDDPLLQPPPFQALQTIREYLTPTPF